MYHAQFPQRNWHFLQQDNFFAWLGTLSIRSSNSDGTKASSAQRYRSKRHEQQPATELFQCHYRGLLL
jgi:hypothetical protein